MNAKQITANATAEAMDQQRAFSWLKTHDVQAGVYLCYTQEWFQTYKYKGV